MKKKKTFKQKLRTLYYKVKYRNKKEDTLKNMSKELKDVAKKYTKYLEMNYEFGFKKVSVENERFTKAILEHIMMHPEADVRITQFAESVDGSSIEVRLY